MTTAIGILWIVALAVALVELRLSRAFRDNAKEYMELGEECWDKGEAAYRAAIAERAAIEAMLETRP
jgi:hypothetical protein